MQRLFTTVTEAYNIATLTIRILQQKEEWY